MEYTNRSSTGEDGLRIERRIYFVDDSEEQRPPRPLHMSFIWKDYVCDLATMGYSEASKVGCFDFRIQQQVPQSPRR